MTTLPDSVRELVAGLLRETGTPGAAIALKIDGGSIAAAGVGAVAPGGAPISAGARFPLYSITKMILSVAALRLVDAGRLALDLDVRELLPDVSLPARITLRQVLDHTSGLPDYGALPAYAADLRRDPPSPWTDAEFFERTLSRGLLFTPGEGWSYSNLGYLLARRIVEAAGGAGSLRAALDNWVFGPAGLEGMTTATSLADMAALVSGYSRQLGPGSELRDVRSRYHPGWVAHGLVTATAIDTARLLAALFDGDLVSPTSLGAMLHGVPVGGNHPPFRQAGYGLGLMLDLAPEIGLVAGHAGGGPGYATAAFRFQAADGRRLTSVALANRDAGDIALRIAFAMAGALDP